MGQAETADAELTTDHKRGQGIQTKTLLIECTAEAITAAELPKQAK